MESRFSVGECFMLKTGAETREFVVLAELQHDRLLVEDRFAHCHVREQRRFIKSRRLLNAMVV